MRVVGELVLHLPCDLISFRDHLGGGAHRRVGVGHGLHETWVGDWLVTAHRYHRHRLDTAGDHNFCVAGADGIGSEGDSLRSRATEAVDGYSGHRGRETGCEGDKAGNIHTLLALRHGAAHDDVAHHFFLEARGAFDESLDHLRCKVFGAGVAKAALLGPADGRAGC